MALLCTVWALPADFLHHRRWGGAVNELLRHGQERGAQLRAVEQGVADHVRSHTAAPPGGLARHGEQRPLQRCLSKPHRLLRLEGGECVSVERALGRLREQVPQLA